MAFRKLVGSYKDYDLSTHVIEDGYLAVDVDTGSLRIGDGVTAGGTVVSGGGGGSDGSSGGCLVVPVVTSVECDGDGQIWFDQVNIVFSEEQVNPENTDNCGTYTPGSPDDEKEGSG